jgi:hypothetical protein
MIYEEGYVRVLCQRLAHMATHHKKIGEYGKVTGQKGCGNPLNRVNRGTNRYPIAVKVELEICFPAS